LRDVAPFGPVRFGRSQVLHGLAVIYLARLERLLLIRISCLEGVQDKIVLVPAQPSKKPVERPSSRQNGSKTYYFGKTLPIPLYG
jgi:hypothetical protein